MFDVIERLKSEWTDRYVVIDSPAPELARFARATGLVRTVNMNGRCLVEFDQHSNVGWYDIDPSCLKVVPKPQPKPAEAREKPAKPAAVAKQAAKPAAKPAASGKPSTADILAAARGKAVAAPVGKEPAAPPATGGKLSTAEILARARGGAGSAPARESAAQPVAAEPRAAADEPPAPPAATSAARPAVGDLPTTTADKIAWCRARDAKG